MLKMADDTQNKQAMKEAVDTLNLIISTNSTPKTIKKSITDLVADLVKEEYSLSVRACYTRSKHAIICKNSIMASRIKIRKYKRINSSLN